MATDAPNAAIEKIDWSALLAPYREPSRWKSFRQLAGTAALLVVFWIATLWSLEVGGYWLTLLAAIPAACMTIRLFMLQHDCGHGSFFRSQRLNNLRAFGLVAPLLLFIILSFVVPILMMLQNAVYDPDIRDNLPEASAVLADWDGKDLPGEEAYAALVRDFAGVRQKETAALIGKRMNYEISGIRSKIIASARKVEAIAAPPYKEALIAADNQASLRAFQKASFTPVCDVIHAKMATVDRVVCRPPDPEAQELLGLGTA